MEKSLISLILNRKSVRSFTDKPVSEDDLVLLLKAGMAAPSARNLQPWMFVVVTNRQILKKLAERLPYAKMLYEAQAAIIVCGNLSKAGDSPEGYWVQDCSAASQNILLAAEAIGLGAVWTGVFPRAERMNVVSEELNLPDHVIPLNVIPIGYPKGEHSPKDKFKKENIRKDSW
ncbi:MAG: nitroreductase family protein [Bacteroidales bacterium]|nr:nitroreductase family protein [Bacteroidales bacterium]HPD94253.1 nitroreductase family protein [Tenuifilaceae bacterium]